MAKRWRVGNTDLRLERIVRPEEVEPEMVVGFAAALLGRRGGQAGTGKAKRRGDSEYYRKLRKRQA